MTSFASEPRASANSISTLSVVKSSIDEILTRPFWTAASIGFSAYVSSFSRYNQIIAEVADETGAVLIDGEMLIPGNGEYFNDTVHFKDAGSRLMAERVSEALLKSPGFRNLVEKKKSVSRSVSIAGNRVPSDKLLGYKKTSANRFH